MSDYLITNVKLLLMKIWIIGAGTIAQEYGKVLNSLGYDYIVIGRGEQSAQKYKEVVGKDVVIGGLEAFLKTNPIVADKAIVATNLDSLSSNTIQLINYGVKDIFCEKPGFLYPSELDDVYSLSKAKGANVFYAYNRRFFASVLKAEEIIKEDGGVKSFNFEFTEWGHVIEKLNKPKGDLENWMYANSTHVIDLAFYLGGNPIEMSAFNSGEISWHKPAVFAGAGITDRGALFDYAANWAAPGRWSVEILTSKHRLYFRPMEQLQIQQLGSVAINSVEIDDSLDKEYKPGFFLQTKAFLNDDTSRLCSVEYQLFSVNNIYSKIHG